MNVREKPSRFSGNGVSGSVGKEGWTIRRTGGGEGGGLKGAGGAGRGGGGGCLLFDLHFSQPESTQLPAGRGSGDTERTCAPRIEPRLPGAQASACLSGCRHRERARARARDKARTSGGANREQRRWLKHRGQGDRSETRVGTMAAAAAPPPCRYICAGR